jgi:hypothetical protein
MLPPHLRSRAPRTGYCDDLGGVALNHSSVRGRLKHLYTVQARSVLLVCLLLEDRTAGHNKSRLCNWPNNRRSYSSFGSFAPIAIAVNPIAFHTGHTGDKIRDLSFVHRLVKHPVSNRRRAWKGSRRITMSSMKAVRFHAAKDIRVDSVPIPGVKPGWVKLKPAFCGICGSDLHEYEDGPHIISTQEKPHGMTGEGAPVTLGHEFAGTIEEVGEGVDGLKPGDKVAIQPTIFDGDCVACRRGLTNSCDTFGFIGLSGWGGGMGEYTVAPANYCKKLPDDMPLEIGALIEPLAVGWHAVAHSPYKSGDDVLVLGGGPIGLAVVLALEAKGCKNIIVAEVRAKFIS